MPLLEKVKALNLPEGKYVIFGTGPLAVRGLKESNDIDILTDRDISNEYKNKEGWEKKKGVHGDEYYTKGDIEIFSNWAPGEWNTDELIETAEIIDGLPFVSLDNVLKWKKIYGREKDLKDIVLIEKYLSSKEK